MNEVERIKKLLDEDNLSYSEVSRIIGLDRRTVKKWYHSKAFPKYNRNNRSSPVKEEILAYIQKWIEEDIEQINNGKINKIRTDTKIYRDLVDMGIKCSERSVNRYSSELRPKEVYIEQEYSPGEDMQVDWGFIDLDFSGDIRFKVKLFVATLPYSNTRFVYPYVKSDSQSFFDGHIRAFDFFGGIPKRIRYDNLSSAIHKVLKGSKREEQDRMIYFKTFFGFETNYCNVAKGNEKGSVENGVGYVKRMYLSGNKVFNDFDELRSYLYNCCKQDLDKKHYCKGKLIKELLQKERSKFRTIPGESFDNSIKATTKVRNTLIVQYEGVRYSVPAKYCGKIVTMLIDINQIRICNKDKVIAVHPRLHSIFHKESLDFRHYLPSLYNKPRALPNAKCIVKSKFPPIFRQYLDGLNSRSDSGNREMVKILQLHKEYNMRDIFFSMEWCYEHKTFSYEAIVMTLKDISRTKPKVEKINKAYPKIKDMPINLKKYDKLIGIIL